MDAAILTVVILAALFLLLKLLLTKKKGTLRALPLPAGHRKLLREHIVFYNELPEADRTHFEQRVQQFLTSVRITGVDTEVDDTDRVMVAASAIIPIFGFRDWEYINLNEVLLYPESFNHRFDGENEKTALGVVGTGAYQNIMVLSRHALREGFLNKTGKTNVGIHEFVHLLDKTDGAVDGIPEALVSKQYIMPWLELMRKEIKRILADRSDINPYGATDESEFFAVVAEYFFERPDLLQDKHPELYKLLVEIFRQQPAGA